MDKTGQGDCFRRINIETRNHESRKRRWSGENARQMRKYGVVREKKREDLDGFTFSPLHGTVQARVRKLWGGWSGVARGVPSFCSAFRWRGSRARALETPEGHFTIRLKKMKRPELWVHLQDVCYSANV